ncbi:MAG: ammonium transporter [Coriobacteriales bacterium]|jgi:Amt family ammonium transporter|nr:ammonium transporter [Coriobacteriales bacterium]
MLDSGTTAFMLLCTMLVFLMTPALSFFYGGLARRKNVINTMFMSFLPVALVGLLWVAVGWSLAYGGDGSNPIIGGFDQLFLEGQVSNLIAGINNSVIFPLTGHDYPQVIDVAFQCAFAMLATACITGAVAGRMKLGALLLFLGLWSVLVYPALAHMVWGGSHSLIGGLIGAQDFAGGMVVEISSGLTGLVLALLLGRRRGFGVFAYRPHNVPFVLLGTGLLWFGWLGFNAGSAFAADKQAALALLNTMVAPAAAMAAWLALERVLTRKCSLVGACTGALAGMVAITPACGFVETWAALVIGVAVAPVCYCAVAFIKQKLGYDDALDVFGVHCIGGIGGVLLTGLFCVPALSWSGQGGLIYTGSLRLLGSELAGVAVTLVFVGGLSLLIGLLVKVVFRGKLALDDRAQSTGLDNAVHGESAYPAFNGLD